MLAVDDLCLCSAPDPIELAWAAGFFDGEGTTIARSEIARPGYHLLQVTVPQRGADGVPEVLLRLQRAVLGLGTIDRPFGAIHRWRARGFVDAQATLALLWRFLGPVKRAQASAAVRTILLQYRLGAYANRQRPPRSSSARLPHASHVPRSATPWDALERAWAAGFFDGEGWTGLVRGGARKKGPRWYRIRASISQKGDGGASAVVLSRFHRAAGTVGNIGPHGEVGAFKWLADDLTAVVRVLGILEPRLGRVKRAQARSAIEAFEAQLRGRGRRPALRTRPPRLHRSPPAGRPSPSRLQCVRAHHRPRQARRARHRTAPVQKRVAPLQFVKRTGCGLVRFKALDWGSRDSRVQIPPPRQRGP